MDITALFHKLLIKIETKEVYWNKDALSWHLIDIPSCHTHTHIHFPSGVFTPLKWVHLSVQPQSLSFTIIALISSVASQTAKKEKRRRRRKKGKIKRIKRWPAPQFWLAKKKRHLPYPIWYIYGITRRNSPVVLSNYFEMQPLWEHRLIEIAVYIDSAVWCMYLMCSFDLIHFS